MNESTMKHLHGVSGFAAGRRLAGGEWFRMREQRGISLLETALVLAVLAVVIASVLRFSSESTTLVRARAAAGKITEVMEASSTFMRSNFTVLAADAPVAPDALVVAAGRPEGRLQAPPGSLQARGFLPASFVDVNGFGQRHALLIQRTANGGLDALVTTHGGREIPDGILGRITGFVGAAGGYVPNNPRAGDAGQVLGAFGGWRTAVADWGPAATRPSPGHAAATLAFGDDGSSRNFLHRNDVGIPEANRMNSNLDMNGNRVLNVSRISGRPNLVLAGEVWAGDNVSIGGALGVGEKFELGGDLHANKGLTVKENIVADGNLESGGNLSVADTASMRSLEVESGADIGGTASVGQIDAERTSIGTVAHDDTGTRGFRDEVRLVDLLPRMVAQYAYQVTETQRLVYKPTCVGGYANARILVHPVAVLGSAPANLPLDERPQSGYADGNPSADLEATGSLTVSNHGESVWRVDWTGNAVAGVDRRAVAQTFCFYD